MLLKLIYRTILSIQILGSLRKEPFIHFNSLKTYFINGKIYSGWFTNRLSILYSIEKINFSNIVNKFAKKGLFKIMNSDFIYDYEHHFNNKRMFYLVKKI